MGGHRTVAAQEIEQARLDCFLDLLQRHDRAAARADRVPALMPAAVDIVAAHAGGLVDHSDRVAAFLAFHQAGQPTVRPCAAAAQRPVAVELALRFQPARSVHDPLVRREGDKAAGQVG